MHVSVLHENVCEVTLSHIFLALTPLTVAYLNEAGTQSHFLR